MSEFKYSVCMDCKIIYHHTLVWCPGCPNQMKHIPLSTIEYEALQKQGYNREGNNELRREYIIENEIFVPPVGLVSQTLETKLINVLNYKYNLPMVACTNNGYLRYKWDDCKKQAGVVYTCKNYVIDFTDFVFYYRLIGQKTIYPWWRGVTV
jgi:hypothetical protein